jgi:hypothetical protein
MQALSTSFGSTGLRRKSETRIWSSQRTSASSKASATTITGARPKQRMVMPWRAIRLSRRRGSMSTTMTAAASISARFAACSTPSGTTVTEAAWTPPAAPATALRKPASGPMSRIVEGCEAASCIWSSFGRRRYTF